MMTALLRPLALTLCLLPGVRMGQAAEGEEFARLIEGMGELEWVAGLGGNEQPLDANDWVPAFEGAPARTVELSNPHFVDADAFGRIYVADKASHSILVINGDGRVFTHAGTHAAGAGTGAEGPATAVPLESPNGLYVKPDGTVFLYDTGNRRICRIAPDGTFSTVFQDTSPSFSFIGRGLWVSPDERTIYFADGTVVKKWESGTVSLVAEGFVELANLDVHPLTGRLHVTDRATSDVSRSAVWRIEADGSRTRVAGNGQLSGGGDGFLATETFLDQVRGIVFTPEGGYFLCTHKGGDVWYVDTGGIIHLFMMGRGSGNRNDGNGLRPPITGVEVLSEPRSVALAPNGDLLIATNDTGYIRRVRSVAPWPVPDWTGVDLPRRGTHRLRWVARPGRTYVVEASGTLAAGAWEVVGVVEPSGGEGEWSGPGPLNEDHWFYRLSPPSPQLTPPRSRPR